MTEFAVIGFLLGLSAGIAPGPLLALVVSETLRHDIRAGIKVAAAPVFTDLPIILVTLFVMSRLSGFEKILGIISLIGGAVIMTMGYSSMKPKSMDHELISAGPGSLLKGILANVLSPHPYLFWLSVGGPLMIKAVNVNLATLFAFTGGFYLLLIGSKVLVAVLVGRSKMFLSGRVYKYTMRLLGAALCILALFLFRDGLRLLDII